MIITDQAGRRVILVQWKNHDDRTFEIFSSLKNFCSSYPKYSYHTLTNYLSKNKKTYENDLVKIERMPVITKPIQASTPKLYKGLFWDLDYELIDWKKNYRTVIERVLERGTDDEWNELVRFYSLKKVVNALKLKIKYLPDHTIEKVCSWFELKKEELACYKRERSRQGHWL